MSLQAKLRAHIIRLTYSSLFLLFVGIPFVMQSQDFQKGLGSMLIGWSVINLIIAFFSFRSKKEPVQPAFSKFIVLNLYFNLTYIAIGLVMLTQSKYTAGTGTAIIIQGLNLFVLDQILHRNTKQ